MKKSLFVRSAILFSLLLFVSLTSSAQSSSEREVVISITDPAKKAFVETVKWLPANFQQAIADDFHLLTEQQKTELEAFSKEIEASKGFDSSQRHEARLYWASKNLRNETFARMTSKQ